MISTSVSKEELKTIEQKVLWELEHNPATRESDKILAVSFYSDFYGLTDTTPFVDVMIAKVPNYETIGRCRRKIQETREDLRAKAEVEKTRIANQEAYIDYAMEV